MPINTALLAATPGPFLARGLRAAGDEPGPLRVRPTSHTRARPVISRLFAEHFR